MPVSTVSIPNTFNNAMFKWFEPYSRWVPLLYIGLSTIDLNDVTTGCRRKFPVCICWRHSYYSGTPLIRPPLGHKILVVITRWSYKRGGRKAGFHCTTVSRFKRYGLYKPYNWKITLKSRQIILGTKYELLLKNERLFATDLSSD